ncbi:MAG: hypothetical protein IPO09_12850 [Anaeromyxobacter sp.]|nr:hypothetical protein [Anaeromyxobacter sp.]MBL0275074.1 hypothetical protein [Anaeromyxobacter sp.]
MGAVAPGAATVTAAVARAGRSPVPSLVADAPAGRTVVLTDAVLRCDTRTPVRQGTSTLFLAADREGAHPFVAQFQGEVTCQDAEREVRGAFIPGAADPVELAALGFDPRGVQGARFFTSMAGGRTLLAALGLLLAVGGGGLALLLLGARGLWRAAQG